MDTSRSHAYSSAFLGELEQIIEKETSSRSVMLSACRKLSEHFGTCVFFNVQKKGVGGFVSADAGEETAYASALKIAFDESSEFKLAARHYMPSQGNEINAVSWYNFLQLRGISSPREFSVLPLMVGGRCPSVFYTDGDAPLGPADSAMLLSALNAIGRKLEELIVKKKLEVGGLHDVEQEIADTEQVEENRSEAEGDTNEPEETQSDYANIDNGEASDLYLKETSINEEMTPEPSGVIITIDSCPTDFSDLNQENPTQPEEESSNSWANMFKSAVQAQSVRRQKLTLPRISELEPEKLEDAPLETMPQAYAKPAAIEAADDTDTSEAPANSPEAAATDEPVVEFAEPETPEETAVDLNVEDPISSKAEEPTETDETETADLFAEQPEPEARVEKFAETAVEAAVESEPDKAKEEAEESGDADEQPQDEQNQPSDESFTEEAAVCEVGVEESEPSAVDNNIVQPRNEYAAGMPQAEADAVALVAELQNEEDATTVFTDDFKTDEDTSIVVIEDLRQTLDAPQTEIDDSFVASEDTAIVVLDMLENSAIPAETQDEPISGEVLDSTEPVGVDAGPSDDDQPERWDDVLIDDEPDEESAISVDDAEPVIIADSLANATKEVEASEQQITDENTSDTDSAQGASASVSMEPEAAVEAEATLEDTDEENQEIAAAEPVESEACDSEENPESQEQPAGDEAEPAVFAEAAEAEESVPLTDYLAAHENTSADSVTNEDTRVTVIPLIIEENAEGAEPEQETSAEAEAQPQHEIVPETQAQPEPEPVAVEAVAEETQREEPAANETIEAAEAQTASEEASPQPEPETEPDGPIETASEALTEAAEAAIEDTPAQATTVEETASDMQESNAEAPEEPASALPESTADAETAAAEPEAVEEGSSSEDETAEESAESSIPENSAEAEKATAVGDKGWHLSQHHPVPIHQFPQLDQINGGDEILGLIQQGEPGIKILQSKLQSPDPRERFKGVIAFAYCYHPQSVRFIADLLFDSEAAVRDLVIKLLPYYREQEDFSIVQDIIILALRPDSKRLAEAVFLAGELRVRKAVPQLIGLLDIGIEKENYTRALQKITMKDLPAKSAKWKKWWNENQNRDEVEWCLDALQEKDTILCRSALRCLERRAGRTLGVYDLANRKDRRKAWQDWNEWWKANKA